MALGLQHNKLGIRDIGVTVQVPDNPYAKLSYYLSCVGCCLDIREELGELANYNRYYLFSNEDKRKIVSLAYLLSPDELIGKCWFPSEDIDSNNEIYELSQVQNTLIVSSFIQIGSESRRVAKIMLFKRQWMQKFYIEPYQTVLQQTSSSKKTLMNLRKFFDF